MMIVVQPSYLKLLESGELSRRASSAWRHLRDCDLCARYCHVDRYETVKGAVCRTGASIHLSGIPGATGKSALCNLDQRQDKEDGCGDHDRREAR